MEPSFEMADHHRSSAGGKDVEKKSGKNISEFRIALAQFLACTAQNLLILAIGMILSFSAIVIPVLLEAKNGLTFTKEQASWFGSIFYICQPIGSVASGFMSETWGRNRTLLLVNFPFILGWFLMYTAYDLYQLYIAAIVLGLTHGFTEAPTLNYVGEICQPKWRGVILLYSQIYLSFGHFVMCLIGALTDWRTAAAISSSVPMLAFVLTFFTPESPVWLLYRGRKEEAQKSLCWLRGWVSPEEIKNEFQEMIKINENKEENQKGAKKILRFFGMDDFFRNDLLRPLVLVLIFQTFAHVSGISGTRPYIVQIFKEFGSSLDPFWCTVINTAAAVLASLIGSLLITKIGKRIICHISFLAGAACCFFLSLYGFVFTGSDASWIPVSLYFLLNFLWSFGIGIVPWQLITEVFPLRGRSVASGISSAFTYLISFLGTKTYYDLTDAFTLPGIFAFFCVTNIIGWIFFYFLIPETEGKTLEEVQIMYANLLKKKKANPSSKLSVVDVENAK